MLEIATTWIFLGFGVCMRMYTKTISSFIHKCGAICFDWFHINLCSNDKCKPNASKISRAHNGHTWIEYRAGYIGLSICRRTICTCIGFSLNVNAVQATWNRKNIHRQFYVHLAFICCGRALRRFNNYEILIGQYDTSNQIVTATAFYCCCCCNVKTRSIQHNCHWKTWISIIDSNTQHF